MRNKKLLNTNSGSANQLIMVVYKGNPFEVKIKK